MEEGNEESEQVSDHFVCAVCLDILYKPIVLVCGHVTCFWCCYRSMDMRGQSYCPLCRHPYRHFPAICQMLDIFLKKIYPISYYRRKKQTLEDEQQSSLGFWQDVDCLVSGEELDHLSIVDQASHFNSGANLSINPSTEEKKSNGRSCAGNYKQVTVADVICAACKQLLFRPAVLNCGHVYCEACITVPEDGLMKCQVCQCRHPSGFPKVFKDLDYFLEEQFSSDYALRRSSTQLDQEKIKNRTTFMADDQGGSKFSYPTEENFLQWWTVHGSKFHPDALCAMCGMYPIIGDRFQCKDCKEKISFDLCGDCCNVGSKLPSRFNQKHTQEHQIELVKPVINRHVIHRLLSGQLAIVSAALRNRSNPVDESSEFTSSSLDDENGDTNDDGVGVALIEPPIGLTEGRSHNETLM